MCQFEHKGKQIKLLPLRPKIGQLPQTPTLALLPTPPSPLLITTVPSLSPTNHTYHARKSLSPLLSIPSHYKAFESVPAFASHKYVHKLHKEISDKNKWSNMKPTLRADGIKIFKTFNVGDYVMVQIYPKQFLSGTVKMLHVRSAGPFKILNKLNCNTYVIDLPRNYGISCTFNVNDLVDYKGFDCSSLIVEPFPKLFFERLSFTPLPDTYPITAETVDKILKNETITIKIG